MPARIADYLTAMEMTRNLSVENQLSKESIISFHPWHKLQKRGNNTAKYTNI
jgi:hypothetical protein